MRTRKIWRRHYALPGEHGAWIWWIGPLSVGAAAGGRMSFSMLVLALTALAAFLLRQPATIAVKALSGRRGRDELRPALVWSLLYGGLALAGAEWLIQAGEQRLLALAVPGIGIFGWHLWLVSRRQERGQPGVEIFAAGALALAAPAAYWIAGGESDRTAWVLWGLTWLQTAASVVHVYLRLLQRRLPSLPAVADRWRMGRRSALYNGFNLLASLGLALLGWVPRLVPLAFAFTTLDALSGILRPAVGVKPTRIGLRQLAVSSAFALLMMLAYWVS